ncbi:hypothetical protein PMAYCL1PPCAC_23670 [Pristionchus mayeri]|uniref:BTB domain-containing protein n=1 Tax=Pristionchus mayeri TaxID=1317129 RepID=A0AAN5I6X1_9BILA|nr:hypothetical protein PMAYCL1PPCAC_23670 [Pristionchus mayeri]
MPSPFDVHIKSAKPLVYSSDEEDSSRPCTLRLGQHLIPTHHGIIEGLPVLAELAMQQGSEETISLSSLLKHQSCLSPQGLSILLDFVHGKEIYVQPTMVADLLAAAHAFRVEELISQMEKELIRLATFDDSILFALEHAILNMDEQSSARDYIVQEATRRLDEISSHHNFVKMAWPTFEVLMKNAGSASPAAVFMKAFIKWVNVNRHDQTRACSLLVSSKIHELDVEEREHFAHRSASLYLHGVSSAMSKLSGSTPFTDKRVLTRRWSTCSDLSISSSVDVVAMHEEPFTTTNTPYSFDCSRVSEKGRLYSDMGDSIEDSMIDDSGRFFDDLVQEECSRLGAGADRSASSISSQSLTPLDMKTIDFGTIPIPDGDIKEIQLSIEMDDHEQAVEYIRKMRFHFDMEVDPKN